MIRVFFRFEDGGSEIPPEDPDLSDIPVFIKNVVIIEDDNSVEIIIREFNQEEDRGGYDLFENKAQHNFDAHV